MEEKTNSTLSLFLTEIIHRQVLALVCVIRNPGFNVSFQASYTTRELDSPIDNRIVNDVRGRDVTGLLVSA